MLFFVCFCTDYPYAGHLEGGPSMSAICMGSVVYISVIDCAAKKTPASV